MPPNGVSSVVPISLDVLPFDILPNGVSPVAPKSCDALAFNLLLNGVSSVVSVSPCDKLLLEMSDNGLFPLSSCDSFPFDIPPNGELFEFPSFELLPLSLNPSRAPLIPADVFIAVFPKTFDAPTDAFPTADAPFPIALAKSFIPLAP